MRGALCVIFVTALVVCGGSAEAQQRPPASAFGELPAIFDAAISPDGHKVVTAERRSGRDTIVVYDLDQGGAVYAANPAEGTELRSVSWAGDNIIAFRSSATLRPDQVLPENWRFRGAPGRVFYERDSVIDLATRRLRPLSVGGEMAWADQGSYLIAPIAGDPGYGRMVGRAEVAEAARRVVYRVNLTTGETHQALVRAGEGTIGYLFAANGDPVARLDTDEASNHWRMFVYDDGGADRLLAEGVNETGAPPSVVGALPDGRIALLDTDPDHRIGVLYAIDRTTGAEEVMFSREGYEINSAIVDPWTRVVVGVSWTETEDAQHFFEPPLQTAHDNMQQHFAGGVAKIISWSRDRGRILVYAEVGLDGGAYYLLDASTNQLRRLGYCYPAIAAAQIGARQSITYRARDGMRVPAYLTLPAGVEAHNLPTVVLVHGGPALRDDMNFDYWAAFLASRGYAVLQPNFRGSSGYGEAWEEAGHGQWGGLMQTDVEDGVAAMVRGGIADANRICIVGASYGGYAALAGATLTPERYQCAASIAGLSDLLGFIRARERTQGSQSMTADYWRMSIGDRQEDEQTLREHSPANLADRVTIPILLMHGTDDTVVPITQSRLMEDRLRGAGKTVRFVELRGDDHWLSQGQTRTQMLSELETFLAQNIGSAPPP